MQSLPYLAIQPLIGLSATVVQSTNPIFARITGQIIDDSHGMLTLLDGLHKYQIPKAACIFDVVLPTGQIARVNGTTLIGHPAERLRRAKKLRW